MSTKMKLSEETSRKLDFLSYSLDLRRNIVCRIAIGYSLGNNSAPDTDCGDFNGYEFNKPTIISADESVVRAMIANHYGHAIDADHFFSTYVRAEITSGINSMYDLYSRINSPVEFMRHICKLDGESLDL